MAEPDDETGEADDRASAKAVWWVVCLGVLLPSLVGLLLLPFRGSAAFERGIASVVFVTVPVVVVGGVGLCAGTEVFRAAAAAGYGFMAVAYVLVEWLGSRTSDVTLVPVWSAGAAVAAAVVMALLHRAGWRR